MTNKIQLDDPGGFSYGDTEGFEVVEEKIFLEDMYKDSAPAYTIAKRTSDGTFWRQNWSKYTSHYGNGENDYEDHAVQVEPEEIKTVVVTTRWNEVK